MPLPVHESALTRLCVPRVSSTSWGLRSRRTPYWQIAAFRSHRQIPKATATNAPGLLRTLYTRLFGRAPQVALRAFSQNISYADKNDGSPYEKAGVRRASWSDNDNEVVVPFNPAAIGRNARSLDSVGGIGTFDGHFDNRKGSSAEWEEYDGDVEEDLTDAAWVYDSAARTTRSRNETYKRRLKQDSYDIHERVDRKKSPRALQNLLKPSPSLYLELALREADDPSILPRQRPHSVHDLSYRDPKTLNILNVNGYREPVIDENDTSLQSITAKFIREALQRRLQQHDGSALAETRVDFNSNVHDNTPPLTSKETQLLVASGYGVADVLSWAQILLEPEVNTAARAFASVHQTSASTIPWFVMNFLLRRENVPAEALRVLLDHAWRLLAADERARFADRSTKLQPPCPAKMMTLCVRLIRHARDVWPQALPNITKLFTTYLLDARLQYHEDIAKPISPSLLKDLTFKSNRLLSQLSLTGKTQSILSAAPQQRAQFDLIRKMVQYQPTLPINREGHRALTKILLLQKRTTQERDWAFLQARSWPPFKISQNRFDDAKDRRYGTSTAGKSIEFMRAYGYPMKIWDFIAQVYTGWNPDGSPSVQQRALTHAVPTSYTGEPDVGDLQAAMIIATRTIPEAWAAFLKFDTPDGQWRAISIAMFKKLLVGERARDDIDRPLRLSDHEPVLAGDGIEVFPPPTSPMEAVYLTKEPPTVDEFFDTLVNRGFPIWGGLMLMLLEKAPSFEFGIKVWSVGRILNIDDNDRASWSLDGHLPFIRTDDQRELMTLPNIPRPLVAALVSCLSAFPHSIGKLAFFDRTDLQVSSWRLRKNHTLVYAYRLLVDYKLNNARAWNHLLKGLANRRSLKYAIERNYRSRERFWPLVAWAMARNVLQRMNEAGAIPDHMTFQCLCDITMEAALVVRYQDLDRPETLLLGVEGQPDLQKEMAEAEILLSQGSSMLRRQFAQLVGLDGELHESHARMPSHLIIPKAAVLHKYVRALGMLGDHEGIYSLVRWMADASVELHELQKTQLNGAKHLRRLIVSLRVWLECPSRDLVLVDRSVKLERASEELIELARQEIEHVRRWGGWPSDRAVDDYCSTYPSSLP